MMPKPMMTLSRTQRTEVSKQTLPANRPFASDQDSAAPPFGHDFRQISISPSVQSKPGGNTAENAQGREPDVMCRDSRQIRARDFLRAPLGASPGSGLGDSAIVAREAAPFHAADMPWLSGPEMEAMKLVMHSMSANVAMQAIEEATPLDGTDGMFALTYGGKTVMMTRGQRSELSATATRILTIGFGKAVSDQAAAEAVYAFDEKETDTGMSKLGRALASNPQTMADYYQMKKAAANARMKIVEGRAAMNNGDFASAYDAMVEAVEQGGEAWDLVDDYHKDMQSSAETGLHVAEAAKEGAEVVGTVTAVVATGGAAAGLVAADTAAGVATIGIAGAMGQDEAVAIADVALGVPVNWAKFTVDMILDVVLGKYGGDIAGAFTEGLVFRFAETEVGKEMEAAAVKAAVSEFVSDEAGGKIKDSVDESFDDLHKNPAANWQMLTDLIATKAAGKMDSGK